MTNVMRLVVCGPGGGARYPSDSNQTANRSLNSAPARRGAARRRRRNGKRTALSDGGLVASVHHEGEQALSDGNQHVLAAVE